LLLGIASIALALLLLSQASVFSVFVIGLVIFFWGFNLLEATLPSLVSRWTDEGQRGRAMGWYSSSQFLGTFLGGALGGLVVNAFGLSAVFYLGFGLVAIWFPVASGMCSLPNIKSFVLSGLDSESAQRLADLVGIVSIKHFPDQREVFVRVDMDRVESQTLENYQLR
jgi:MFS family permease